MSGDSDSDNDSDDEAEAKNLRKINISRRPSSKKRRGHASQKSSLTTGRAQGRPHPFIERQEWEIKEIMNRRHTLKNVSTRCFLENSSQSQKILR